MNYLITNNQTSNFFNYITTLLEKCKSFYFNVAFVNYSGIQLLLDSLKKCEKKGVKGKILTSTYLNFTEVKALERLSTFQNLELKIYDNDSIGFHSKAYIFELEDSYEIVIGSSNITASAFKSNIEWNVKTLSQKDDIFFKEVDKEFKELWDKSFSVNDEFLGTYSSFQRSVNSQKSFTYKKELSANSMQQEALERLNFLRVNNQKKALAISATGSGKTYLAAFDAKNYNPSKLLFIVHRENILLKAKESFKIICKKKCGIFSGNKKEKADFLFATIQSLSLNLNEFRKDEFDYIIIDEAHHVTSPSYKKVYEYFEPKFLLGLTATPNRMDKANIYEVFEENIACDIRLNNALENNLIVPFHYYGISDIKELDYEKVDLTNIAQVAKFLMLNRRVDYIIEKLKFYGNSGNKRKALGFCISKEHSRFMSEEFNKRGIPSISLSSEDTISKRTEVIERLEDEENSLEVVFSVDIFNEGVDIPSINTIMMLRPTNSPIVFIQQLGRGLRKYKNKEFLTLLDFIGNHNRAYQVAFALLGEKALDKDSVKLSLINNFPNIKNAHIFMDEISKQRILEQIDKENFNNFKYLKERYLDFKQTLGRIPNLVDYISSNELISPLDFISSSKSYIEFVSKVEKNEELKSIYTNENLLKAMRFVDGLLPVKRVYEFVILKYLLENKSCDKKTALHLLRKYLENVDEDTISHSFKFLNQNYLDSAQKGRALKLVEFKDEELKRTREFEVLLDNLKYKKLLEDSLNYGLLVYENSFGIKNYGLPFLKLYEKYNMLNIAQLCNFNKIHSSFRGSGFLKFKDDFFLFFSIEKDKFTKGEKYNNTFLSKEIFTYSSKPSHSQDRGDGKRLINNKSEKVRLHIFARKFTHVDKKTQGFIYLGLANTISYKNDRPIDCELKLEVPLSNSLYEEFTKLV